MNNKDNGIFIDVRSQAITISRQFTPSLFKAAEGVYLRDYQPVLDNHTPYYVFHRNQPHIIDYKDIPQCNRDIYELVNAPGKTVVKSGVIDVILGKIKLKRPKELNCTDYQFRCVMHSSQTMLASLEPRTNVVIDNFITQFFSILVQNKLNWVKDWTSLNFNNEENKPLPYYSLASSLLLNAFFGIPVNSLNALSLTYEDTIQAGYKPRSLTATGNEIVANPQSYYAFANKIGDIIMSIMYRFWAIDLDPWMVYDVELDNGWIKIIPVNDFRIVMYTELQTAISEAAKMENEGVRAFFSDSIQELLDQINKHRKPNEQLGIGDVI